jgi:hypothetical protein
MMLRLDVDWSMIITIAIIMAIVAVFIIGVSAAIKFVAIAEGFSYNKTEEFEKESRLLNACIFYHLDSKACDQIYGGTN